jgi:predicted dehydrogenase
MKRLLRMGMVGGGRGAFIGEVHRMAARLDGHAHLVAGCFASTPHKALASGEELHIARDRNYPTWQAMLEGEMHRSPDQRVDFVSIVTPNHLHFPVARSFAAANCHVVCDKPMAVSTAEATELVGLARNRPIVFAVTYNYSGYPMVKHARAMIRNGELGDIRKVVVEYHQGWLATNLESTGHKQAAWRTDPAQAGLGGAIGDIGSHAEQLVSTVTGLKIESICVDLTSFVSGRALDDDASMLLRFQPVNGVAARGVLMASQIAHGCENDLRLRVFGSQSSLDWRQEEPNTLIVKRADGSEQILRRAHASLSDDARRSTRLPTGHPEGYIEAFANIYDSAFRAMHSGLDSEIASGSGMDAGAKYDFPDVVDGARGVHFIEKAIESARSNHKWTDARFNVPES